MVTPKKICSKCGIELMPNEVGEAYCFSCRRPVLIAEAELLLGSPKVVPPTSGRFMQINDELVTDEQLAATRELLRAYAEDVQKFDPEAYSTIAALYTSISAFPASVDEWLDEYPQSKREVLSHAKGDESE